MKCLNIRIVFFDMGGVLVPMASSVQDFKHHVEAAFNINDFSTTVRSMHSFLTCSASLKLISLMREDSGWSLLEHLINHMLSHSRGFLPISGAKGDYDLS